MNQLTTYVIIPTKVLVEDDSSTKTTSRVDTSAGDRDGCQVNQEHREPNRQRCQNLLIYSTHTIRFSPQK